VPTFHALWTTHAHHTTVIRRGKPRKKSGNVTKREQFALIQSNLRARVCVYGKRHSNRCYEALRFDWRYWQRAYAHSNAVPSSFAMCPSTARAGRKRERGDLQRFVVRRHTASCPPNSNFRLINSAWRLVGLGSLGLRGGTKDRGKRHSALVDPLCSGRVLESINYSNLKAKKEYWRMLSGEANI